MIRCRRAAAFRCAVAVVVSLVLAAAVASPTAAQASDGDGGLVWSGGQQRPDSVGDAGEGLVPGGLGPEGSLGPVSGDGLSAAEVAYPNLGSQLSALAVATAAGVGSGGEAAVGDAAQSGGTNAPQGGEPLLLTVQLDGNRTDVLGFLADNGVTPANVVGDYLEVYVPPVLLGPLAQQTGVSRVREM